MQVDSQAILYTVTVLPELDPGTYIVAVSGGVDSVVLLDMLARASSRLSSPGPQYIVAHFDHGIRDDSRDDAQFVEHLAKMYGLVYESERVELGMGASEELARTKRYEFLRGVAKKHDANIVTAHHADDVIETVALNLTRGTGWRGLAVFGAPDILRPLVMMTKQEITDYAVRNTLTWREDSTNSDQRYLRNQLRSQLTSLDEDCKLQLLALWRQQQSVVAAIDTETARFLDHSGTYQRSFIIQLDHDVARELLRAAIYAKTNVSPTRPQIDRALIQVKTARPGTRCDVGSRVCLVFTRTKVSIQTP